jgi:magnesium-protoporphyrin IX monomethyl ester (oxidative) cyclase
MTTTTTFDAELPNAPQRLVGQETILTPRFYRTDCAAMDRLDISPVRAEWDGLMAEFERDENRAHFRQDDDFGSEVHQ